jgi:hypothetical protein
MPRKRHKRAGEYRPVRRVEDMPKCFSRPTLFFSKIKSWLVPPKQTEAAG